MPLYGDRKPEDAKFMTKTQVAALLHAARDIERNPRAYFMLSLMYLLGLRISEARMLEWTHLGPLDEFGEPTVVTVPTLKQRQKTVPLVSVPVLSHPKLVLFAFNRRRAEKDKGGRRSQYLFPSARHIDQIAGPTPAWRLFDAARRSAGLPDYFSPHALRHTAATELGSAGAPHVVIQRFLRHASENVTDAYTHVAPSTWAQYRGALDLPPLAPIKR